jgi:probable blue pigment (indigoidine) exporter
VEGKFRWVLVTAIAPVAWGSNYYVTREFLPAGHPLYGGAFRAVPAGLLLLAVCRRLPRGVWWWRSLVLGSLNMGAFFALIYLAAQLLPTSIAATVMATSPVVMMLFAWPLLADPPRARHLAGAGVGIAGVALLLFAGPVAVDLRGVLASATAMVLSSFGYVLAKRWSGSVDVLSLTSWQLVAGGLVLLPFAIAVEGTPPAMDGPAVLGFAYVAVIATALAFVAWFTGLRHLDAGTVGIVGLLNPVTGALLGTVVAAETLNIRQLCGMALVLTAIANLAARPFRPGCRFHRRRSLIDHSLSSWRRSGRPNGICRRTDHPECQTLMLN